MALWFTSDLHFYHFNIIRYCNRPFGSVEEMNEILIANWNRVVKPDDEIHCLGDLCFDFKSSLKLTSQLNGIKHLTVGNHDACHPCHKKKTKPIQAYLDAGWQSVEIVRELDTSIGKIILNHFPYVEESSEYRNTPKFTKYRLSNQGLPLICGHVHDRWQVRGNMVNCGVDTWGYEPVSLQTILALFLQKKI